MTTVASDIEQLAAAAAELAEAAQRRPGDLAERAGRLAERLAAGRLHISVLGEFKRGKSTVINALLGADVLPCGALPLTAVATEVSFGTPGAIVVHLDGHQRTVGLEDLSEFVTEVANAANCRDVARVEVRYPAAVLAPGVVLVDTPGTGSVHAHNDRAARRALLDTDAAIIVLCADTPISQPERDLLRILAERRTPVFVVVNKIDHLDAADADQVAGFVTGIVHAEIGPATPLWFVSARSALDARRCGQPDSGAGDFAHFEAALAAFVDHDLVEARLATGRHELGRLAAAVDDAVTVEAAAAALDADTLAARAAAFAAAAVEQTRAFDDERALLARDVARLNQAIAARLAGFARVAPDVWQDSLAAVAAGAGLGDLEERLADAVEAAVRDGFEAFRAGEAEHAQREWAELAGRFRARTQQRVDALRAAAAGLFNIALPDAPIGEVGEERERFFYLFLHLDPQGVALGRAMRRLAPDRVVRARLLVRARAQLAAEFDKHAGRARWDLQQRLETLRRRFEAAMTAQLAETANGIAAAAARAGELHHASVERLDRKRIDDDALRQAAANARLP